MSEQNTQDFDLDRVELPAKRVTGDTMEDVLTTNAYENILPARYENDDESTGELFVRVARNVSFADALYYSNEHGYEITATPQDIKPNAVDSRRRDICHEIFGEDVGLEDDVTVTITEDNLHGFAYDEVVPDLPEDVQEHVQETYEEFHDLMTTLSFMPNSPTIMNAGDDFQQLSACFVNSPEDDITDIHETVKQASEIFQSGGGVGYAFSRLRPYGDRVKTTGGESSGPISFMRTFDQMCGTIAQGGMRRGAQMGILRADHPDILQFIHAKDKDVSLAHSLRLNDPDDFTHNSFGDALEEARDLIQEDEDGVKRVPEHLRNAAEGHLSNFNISVGATGPFMEAVQNDEEYTLINPRTNEPHIVDRRTKELYSWFGLGDELEVGEEMTLPAREVFNRITRGAWDNGEPGMIFLDRANEEHSFDVEEHPEHRIEATNPCLSGDMEVAVAGEDRDSVPIEELAKRDETVLVYSLEDDGSMCIKEATAFKTRENVDTVTINTDDDLELEVTPDHKIRTNNRGWVKAENLDEGDSLRILKQWITGEVGGKGSAYKMVNSNGELSSEHKLIAEDICGFDTSGDTVIHHKNFDSLDNSPENLEKVSREDDKKIHDISGDNNPIHKLKKQGNFEEYKEDNPFYDTKGKENPMYGSDRSEWVTITCKECGNEFEVTPHLEEERDFCSTECSAKHREASVQKECVVCGSEFEVIPSNSDRRYCSRQCSGKEFDDNLSESDRTSLSERMESDNPMVYEAIARASSENTDYDEVGSKISKTRKQKLESGELEKVVEQNGKVECHLCGAEFKSITNTHLNSSHNMSVDEYKDEFPEAEINGGKQVKIVENHKVVSVEESVKQDVYDLNVPQTHNFFAGKEEINGVSVSTFANVHNCGEQPLEQYEACNLGHINLSTIVSTSSPDWRKFSQQQDGDLSELVDEFLEDAIDWDILDRRIEAGTHFLENVVTMSDFPFDEITEKVSNNRKVGLGIMGLAQMYVQIGVKYGTDTADEIARQLMRYINHQSKRASHEMAVGDGQFAERNVFTNWHKSKYADPEAYPEWFEKQTGEDPEDWSDGYPIRNHNTTTIAPTGTTSMIGNTSGGCEPIYRVAYYKNVSSDVQGDEMLVEFDDYFLRVLESNGIDVEQAKQEAQELMSQNEFDGIDSLDSVPNEIGELFVTTDDLSAEQHAQVQCALQEGIDSSISKTVNAPTDATPEDARDAFLMVYENGGKGITYYRDGTRAKQVLTTREDNQDTEDDPVETVRQMLDDGEVTLDELGVETQDNTDQTNNEVDDSETLGRDVHPVSRPKVLNGSTEEINTAYGDLFVSINETPKGQPFEVFANIGKSGGYTESFTEATARLISLCLRTGIDPDTVVDQIDNIGSPKVSWDRGDKVKSVPDGIALAMRRHLNRSTSGQPNLGQTELQENTNTQEDTVEELTQTIDDGSNPECPECGSLSLYYSEGCKTCEKCGWSECS